MNDPATKARIPKHIKKFLWHLPFVTGHTYQIFWDGWPDFNHITLWRSEEWLSDDKGVLLRFPYDDQRQKFTVSPGYKNQTELIDP